MYALVQMRAQPTHRARIIAANNILNALFTALVRRDSPYASVIAAVLEITGHRAERVEIRPEPAMDEAWAEPAAFDGCSSQGKSRPGAEQPVHFVRRPKLSPAP